MFGKIAAQIQQLKKYQFLFSELVKRDFKKKYKRTVLGMVWSILSPLMQLAVMAVVFTKFFGRNTEHYIIYLFSGNLVFSFYKDATNGGMHALMQNANIIKKINVPKYLFMISKEVSSCINFGLTLIIYFLFVAIDGIPFSFRFFALLYPIACLVIFNIGVGFILSAMFVIFKDVQYLYDIFTQLLMYLSAIFYTIDAYSDKIQMLFYLNPVFTYIDYFRSVVINGAIPGAVHHLLCAGYALVALFVGMFIYKKYNYKFMYYI
ncbi:MAG: ABC transporter permease [Ruminococcus sp.]|nr:ABC transporter permease [Ruminococcus sp.]